MVCPAATASRSISTGFVLLTAISRTEAGSRPDLEQAAAMRPRTRERPAATSTAAPCPPPRASAAFPPAPLVRGARSFPPFPAPSAARTPRQPRRAPASRRCAQGPAKNPPRSVPGTRACGATRSTTRASSRALYRIWRVATTGRTLCEMRGKDLLRELQRTVDELAVLNEIGKALTSSLDIGEVMHVILAKVSELLKPSNWSLLLKDHGTGELYFHAAVGEGSD